MVDITRGIRNNNPGNIRRSKAPWQGLAAKQTDTQFFQFSAPVWGIRAIVRVLMTYRDKHDCMTIADIISRWAPRVENNTTAYINHVCKRCNAAALDMFDVKEHKNMRAIVVAIIAVECGRVPYDAVTIDKALELAGIVETPPSKLAELVQNPTVALSTASATATTVGSTIAQMSQVWDSVNSIVNPRVVLSVLLVVTISATVYVVYDWLRKRRMMGF